MALESQKGALVLVVDDEAIEREVIISAIKGHYDVISAASASEALAVVKKHTPNVIILDIEMPDMNGFELCTALKMSPSLIDSSFIFITCHDDAGLERKALAIGAADFITKPIHADICLMRVNNQVKLQQQADVVKLALEQTHSEKQHLKAILRSISDGVIATDIKQVITYMNPVAQRLTGVLAHEAQGMLLTDVMVMKTPSGEAINNDPLATAMLQKRVITTALDVVLCDKSGESHCIELTATPLFDANNIDLIGGVISFQDVTDMVVMSSQVSHLASHDQLTGLPNRLSLTKLLEQEIVRAKRTRMQVAVLMFDLDNFKVINDTIGHQTGDQVIKCVANRLQLVCHERALISRVGGDEFVLIMNDCVNHESINAFALDVVDAIRPPLDILGEQFRLTVSMGISIFPQDAHSSEDLIRHADAAMYKVKNEGRNAHAFYSETLTLALRERVNIEKLLHRRLDDDALIVYYQPKYCLSTLRVVGVEALVRMKDDNGAIIPPDKFIHFAEESGLIRQIGEQVLEQSCKQVRQWLDVGITVEVAVNIGASQFNTSGFVDLVERTLVKYSVPPHLLELEITESALLQDVNSANRTIAALQTMGVSIALDDFGTGYSSLSYLNNFSFDVLKIDRAFTKNICSNAQSLNILQAIISLATSLDLRVVCEGIETTEHLNKLVELQCEQGQGYLFCRPMPASLLSKELGIS